MKLLIVNYHYFREQQYSSGIYPTSKAALLQQTETLSRDCKFVGQEDVLAWIEQDTYPDGNYCLLTFDDGLREQMDAFELLAGKGIPAVFYVPTHPIQSHTVLNVHQLHHIRTCMDDADIYGWLSKNSGIDTYSFDETALANQYRYDTTVARKVKFYLNFGLSEAEKSTVVRGLFTQIVPDEAAFSRMLYMDASDLRRLSDAGALGSHGSTHQPLALLSPETAAQDIQGSVDYLQATTGRPVLSFSYPFGGQTAVSVTLQPALENAGIQFALTMQRGLNTVAQFQQPYFLRRIDTNDAPGGKNPLPDLW